MCTVTIVARDQGFRLACNRDERRGRPPARPPRPHTLQERTAVFPLDPAGPGTWVGVNDAGLAAALLNRTRDSAQRVDRASFCSRGLIIPSVLACGSLVDATEAAVALDPGRFDLFRLVLVQHSAAVVIASDGTSFSLDRVDLSGPMMLTSSSLGDALVDPPRRALFDRLFKGGERSWLHAQGRFHRHQWRSNPGISVRMERPDAHTVSCTVVDVRSRSTSLRYRPLGLPSVAVGIPVR